MANDYEKPKCRCECICETNRKIPTETNTTVRAPQKSQQNDMRKKFPQLPSPPLNKNRCKGPPKNIWSDEEPTPNPKIPKPANFGQNSSDDDKQKNENEDKDKNENEDMQPKSESEEAKTDDDKEGKNENEEDKNKCENDEDKNKSENKEEQTTTTESCSDNSKNSKNTSCEKFLLNINDKLKDIYHANAEAQWKYEAHITEKNKKNSITSDTNFAQKLNDIWKDVQKFDKQNKCSAKCGLVSRQFDLLSRLGDAILPPAEFKELQCILRTMESTYSTATIKSFGEDNQTLVLEPDITNIMACSRNPEELEFIWTAWRNATGEKIKNRFPRYVELMNKAAELNGFRDAAEMWLSVYEDGEIEKKLAALWFEIEPLYQQLHAYVRSKLREYYGNIEPNGLIPIHLLGNIFGQNWLNLLNITMPYPCQNLPDMTGKLQEKGYTVKKMFKQAESFFKSINLCPMTKEFWKNSILESKDDVKMVCHASAWDMYAKNDFRIKMCTHVTYEDFITIHHEMGHIEYYMQYKNLPVVFRDGANPGFHEAIGDVIALSVATPGHMKSLKLLVDNNSEEHQYEKDINFLFMMALQKVAFLPYALIVDLWRWDVFRGNVEVQDYNKHWWYLRKKYQGVKPPNCRSEKDFDPGSKYHVAASVPYIRYFISHVIQFQFHEALCKKAGKLDGGCPLHKCDIYQSAKAGKVLKSMLALGQSKPWPEAMYTITRTREMSASSLMKYFEPLTKWLQDQNEKMGLEVGWNNASK